VIFDTYYCLRRHPELRDLGELDTLSQRYQEVYGNQECVDPGFDIEYYSRQNGLSFATFEEGYRHWMEVGRPKGYDYAPGKNTVLKVILKTKDEEFLLEPWLLYYSKIVGWENIIVLDHGSESPIVRAIYEKYADKPITIFPVPRDISNILLQNMNFKKLNMRIFYDLVRSNCLFFAFFDTDEFLCCNDETKLSIKNVISRLRGHANLDNISTTWIRNCYFNRTPASIKEVKYFSLNPKELNNGVGCGKTIFRNDRTNGIIGHASCTDGLNYSTDFILLHIDKTDIDLRIKRKIDSLISKGLLSKTDDIFMRLGAYPEEKVTHEIREVLTYLKDRDCYLRSLMNYDANNCLYSNVIESTLDGCDEEYKFISDAGGLTELLLNCYERVKSRLRLPTLVR